MRQRATRMSGNAHGPLKPLAALFAATSAPAFDWSAWDLSTQYQDNGGTRPVTAVEQPAGLILDRSKGGAKRGPEVIQNGDFNSGMFAWTSLHATATVSNGQLSMAATPAGSTVIGQLNRLTIGAIYEVQFDIVSISAGGVSVGSGSDAGNAKNTVGRHRDVIVAAAASCAVFARSVATTAVVDNISVRQITGPNLWTGTPSVKDANWTDNGDGSFTSNGSTGLLGWPTSLKGIVAGRTYECIVRVTARTAGQVTLPYDGAGSNNTNAAASTGTFRRIFTAATTALYIYGLNFNGIVDSIYIAEIPGNHLIQPTAPSRPFLTARVNLLTYSEQISHANWVKSAGGTGTAPVVTDNFGAAPDGTTTAARVQLAINGGTTTADISRLLQPITNMPVGGTYSQGLWLKTNDGTTKVVQFRDDNSATVGKNITVTGAWQYFSQDSTVSAGSTTVNAIGLWCRGGLGTADSADLLMWHPQFNYGAPVRYQRIGAATDYDSVGFAKGWRFDGTDDSLYSPAAIAWGTSKVSITAAIRKQSDAATAMVAEFGPISTSDGTFYLAAPLNAGAANVGTGSRGTSAAFVAVTGVPAPAGLILSMTGDIAAPSIALRVNGVPSNASSTTQGAGSYGNYVMNVGRRNNSSNPFNGVIHSLRGNGRVQSPDELGWLEAQGRLDMSNNL